MNQPLDIETETLMAEAILGDDAEKFLKTDLGKYLIESAEQETTEALHILKTVDPNDKVKITELQNKIWRAESFKDWLVGLINAGSDARNILQSKQE
jgi:hypothetical protein